MMIQIGAFENIGVNEAQDDADVQIWGAYEVHERSIDKDQNTNQCGQIETTGARGKEATISVTAAVTGVSWFSRSAASASRFPPTIVE